MSPPLAATARRESPRSWPRLRIGRVWIDAITFAQALEATEALVRARDGGVLFTPNVDHVVIAESHPEFAAAYGRAALSVVDGMPLVWASRLLGRSLPEKISGSDLVWPVLQLAARHGFRVYL